MCFRHYIWQEVSESTADSWNTLWSLLPNSAFAKLTPSKSSSTMRVTAQTTMLKNSRKQRRVFDVLNRDTRRNCNELLVTATLNDSLFNDSLMIGNCGRRQVSCSERCLVGVKQVVSSCGKISSANTTLVLFLHCERLVPNSARCLHRVKTFWWSSKTFQYQCKTFP